MRRLIGFFCFAGILAAGCTGTVEISSKTWEESSSQSADAGQTLSEEEAAKPKTLYVTGVEYPADYDWRADLGSDAQGSTLFLMKDSVRIVEVAVGYDNCVSSDADMHRCIDGHLYTDFSTASETVVKMDGNELFRYEGREMIEDMCVRGGNVYTIGVPRSGSGWTYRCNGDVQLSKTGGALVGELYEDNGSLVFSYLETDADTGEKNYYIVVDGFPSPVTNSGSPAYVDDIRRIDGTVYYIASASSSGARTIYYSSQSVHLETSGSYTMYGDLRILYDGGDIIIYGSLGEGAAVWRWSELECFISTGRVLGICVSDSGCCYVTNKSRGGEADRLYVNGSMTDFPEGYDLVYSSCIGADSGTCCIGMSKTSDSYRPALWTNGEIADFDFNGVFTGVYYQ